MNTNQEIMSRHARSISNDPESIQPWRHARSHEMRAAAWILCRNLDQCPIADDELLVRLTERGRVRADDYLVSTRLDQCVQARDVAELDAIFRTATAHRLELAARALVAAALALACLEPLLGSVVLFSAIVTMTASIRTAGRRGTCLITLMEV